MRQFACTKCGSPVVDQPGQEPVCQQCGTRYLTTAAVSQPTWVQPIGAKASGRKTDNCPSCGKFVSRQAFSCPNCGHPFRDAAASSDTAGQLVAAVCSFFIPGLGQLVQGRIGSAAGHFLLCIVLWLVVLGWLVHFASAYDAATWRGSGA